MMRSRRWTMRTTSWWVLGVLCCAVPRCAMLCRRMQCVCRCRCARPLRLPADAPAPAARRAARRRWTRWRRLSWSWTRTRMRRCTRCGRAVCCAVHAVRVCVLARLAAPRGAACGRRSRRRRPDFAAPRPALRRAVVLREQAAAVLQAGQRPQLQAVEAAAARHVHTLPPGGAGARRARWGRLWRPGCCATLPSHAPTRTPRTNNHS